MSFVYDIAEMDDVVQFVYDVKILYQLKGHRVHSLHELCRSFLDHEQATAYYRVCDLLRSHIRSYVDCGINVDSYKINEIIPENVLAEFGEQKKHVISRLFYRFSDEDVIQFYERFFPKLQCLHRVSANLGLKFNFVGSRTGRLSFKHNTFNPYMLPKDQRSRIRARPGSKIYQFDLKSSQPRIAIFSTFNDRFKRRFADVDDIYSQLPGERDKIKVSFLRWMFSATYACDDLFGKLAEPIKELRSAVYVDSVHHHHIHNAFGRPLFFSEEEKKHSHIVFQRFISSTEADALYEIMCDLEQLLQGTQSRILFPFYDAVIVEIADVDTGLADKIKNVIENHYLDHMFFCRFPVDVKCGSDLANVA